MKIYNTNINIEDSEWGIRFGTRSGYFCTEVSLIDRVHCINTDEIILAITNYNTLHFILLTN